MSISYLKGCSFTETITKTKKQNVFIFKDRCECYSFGTNSFYMHLDSGFHGRFCGLHHDSRLVKADTEREAVDRLETKVAWSFALLGTCHCVLFRLPSHSQDWYSGNPRSDNTFRRWLVDYF